MVTMSCDKHVDRVGAAGAYPETQNYGVSNLGRRGKARQGLLLSAGSGLGITLGNC